jgi:voltage-gated potassium channel
MDEIRKKLYVSVSIIVLIVVSGTVGFYFLLDNVTLIEAFYFTIVTVATVGYGDISPHSNIPKESFRHGLGEVYAAVLIILGISAFLYALGVVTEQVVSGDLQRERRRRRMQKLIGRLRGHYLVCGGGETGTNILRELEKTARPGVLIEQSEERIRVLQREFPRLPRSWVKATSWWSWATCARWWCCGAWQR